MSKSYRKLKAKVARLEADLMTLCNSKDEVEVMVIKSKYMFAKEFFDVALIGSVTSKGNGIFDAIEKTETTDS